MSTELPYAADAEVSLNYDELEVRPLSLIFAMNMILTNLVQVLRAQHEKEQAQAHVTVQTKFNYAWGLVKSPMREHQVEGVRLLQGAYFRSRNCPLPQKNSTEIYRAEPTRRRECLYYLALGHYKMGNFDEAKRFNGMQDKHNGFGTS